MTKPLFSVIIPACNRWDLTEACLRSLAAHSGDTACEVIVVDNGSTDETAAALEPLGSALFGSAFLRLRHDDNRNYAAGCNAGARAAAADLLFFLNNDTLLTPGFAPPLLRALADNPGVGIVGPLLLYPQNDRVQHIGVAVHPVSIQHLYRHFPAAHPVVRRSRSLQAITAAALLMPAALFAACGMFCEEYRNGFEDIELCHRALQAGTTPAVATDSIVYHFESQSQGRNAHDADNASLFLRRCGQALLPDYHRMALDDGYLPRFTPTLSVELRLPPEHEEAMPDPRTDVQAAYEALLREPMWRDGYPLVQRQLESAGHTDAALALCLLERALYPDGDTLLRLAKMATRRKNAALAKEAADALRAYESAARDPVFIAQRERHVEKTAAETRDEALTAMLLEWRQGRNHFQPKEPPCTP